MGPAEVILELVEVVWRQGNLTALPRFFTEDCTNHADGGAVGLDALVEYHRGFAAQLEGFADVAISVVQQAASGDRVATHVLTTATHQGRPVSLASMRFDRLVGGRVAEHWSVADLAGLSAQLAP